MDNIFNPMSAMIIRESADVECSDKYEVAEATDEFSDALSGIPTIATEMAYSVESLPILTETVDGEKCYMIEHDILTKFMESYGMEDPVEAHKYICEHYGLNTSSLIVVIESDAINEGVAKRAKKTKNLGLMASYTKTIKDLKNKGIRMAKKKNKRKITHSADILRANRNLKKGSKK